LGALPLRFSGTVTPRARKKIKRRNADSEGAKIRKTLRRNGADNEERTGPSGKSPITAKTAATNRTRAACWVSKMISSRFMASFPMQNSQLNIS
jgi:hypothetical protein